jgi:AraC-like DNA-binding protein/mannose-6-phosphate isomerase-like protein (cupin superfamily)
MPQPNLTNATYYMPPRPPTSERPLVMTARDMTPDLHLAPHQHPVGQVTYAPQGVVRVTANNSSWIVPPQRAIWIPPDVEHGVAALENSRLRPLYVHATRSPFAGDECVLLEVSPLLRELIAALEQLDPNQQPQRELLLANLILDELGRSATRPIRVPLPSDKRLKALCDALIADPGAEHTLATWATQVGASERTLVRLFEKELGLSFGQWRQQVRLAHAVPLIARGLPLSHVAEQLGYASQSAFSAMFKKTFGRSPSTFFTA